MAEVTPKPFYKDFPDTLAEVGITRKQLTYWRSKGLFEPELGPGKFTARDIAQLLALKRLIVELGLRIETVQRLIAGAGREWARSASRLRYIDLDEVALTGPRAVIGWAMEILLQTGSDANLEYWFRTFALVRLMAIRAKKVSPQVYDAQKRELLADLEHLDQVARAEVFEGFDEDDPNEYYMNPSLPGDPDDQNTIKSLVERQQLILGRITRFAAPNVPF